jgi:glyoxylase-like metal-dependent hydrolase (beta-lactamase superfamily II)
MPVRKIRGLAHCGWLGLFVAALSVTGAPARAAAPVVRLWRLQCGTFVSKHLTDSCYLIRHGRELMLWDAGLGTGLLDHPMPYRRGSPSIVVLHRTIVSQLAALGLRPRQVGIVALSHVHSDHIGQAAAFPHARLVVGRKDWQMLTAAKPPPGLDPARLEPWIDGRAPKTLVTGDYDVFADGSVVMLATPGHTPGHHSLLVRLQTFGPVLLSGDLYDSDRQRERQEPAVHDFDRAATLRSFHRFEALAASLHATVIIQHEPADIAKLPLFPRAAD